MLSYIDPNNFAAQTDDGCIQQAIDEAARTGCNRVVIPSYNKRRGAYIWIIENTLLLPSHMELVIDGAHLRMADGVMCQMMRNSHAMTDLCKRPEGMQEGIVIRGLGNAVLDGGKHNGLREDNSGKDGMPLVYNNLTIYLHQVKDFHIQGLHIRDQRWWAMACAFCWDGVIEDLHFAITDHSYRKGHPDWDNHPWRNQDGVDLRIGCHDIQIRNITGETCDDVVALTALGTPGSPRFEDVYRCEHMSPDIRNVTIRNITAFCNHCAMVRLLCHFGNKLYNIHIDSIVDASPEEHSVVVNEGVRTAVGVKVGEYGYHKNDLANLVRPGDMKNISISNVFCSGYTAVALNGCVEDVTVRDIFVTEKGRHALSVARISGGKHVSLKDENNVTTARNITVSGVHFAGKREGASAFFFDELKCENFRIRDVVCDGEKITVNRSLEENNIIWE